MLSSIRTRLTLSHVAVIAMAMALSGVLLLSVLEQYYMKAMEEGLMAQAQLTAQLLIPGASLSELESPGPSAVLNTLQQQGSNLSLEAENVKPQTGQPPMGDELSYLENASLQLSSQLDTRIRILDSKGAVLVDSRQEQQGANLRADPLVAGALAGKRASRTEGTGADTSLGLVLPVETGGRLVGVIYVSQPLRDVAVVLRDVRNRWVLTTLVALVLSAAAALLLSGAITRPLRRLTSAAAAVAQGQLDQQVPVTSRDELGRLSQAFNQMTQRLSALRRSQMDFVANVSHELRTPLTTVKGMVETLRDGAADDPEVRDRFLDTVGSETDRLIRLVNDLLVLSRADSKALDLQYQPVDLRRLAAAVAARLAPLAQKGDVSVHVHCTADGVFAFADPSGVEQVLTNLLDNAIKYSPRGGTAVVRIASDPDGVARVEVTDQGMGIAAKALPRVGERFYRADRARSRSDGGSGLGLAIARALVEAHGGRLTVESQEGFGTAVTFTLPLSPNT